MSRRRPDSMHLQVWLDVVCPAGHPVGAVIKFVEPHPRAGKYAMGTGTRFEEPPTPGPDTGRVRGTCEQCGADVQIAWRRAREALDAAEKAGRHTGKLTP